MITFRRKTAGAIVLVAVLLTGCGKQNQNVTAPKAPAEPATPPPAPGFVRFVNSPDGLVGGPAEHYTDFWFDYPTGCEVSRQSRGMPENFVRVNRLVGGEVAEQFNVGWFSIDRPGLDLQAGIDELVANIKSSLPGAEAAAVLTDGRTKVSEYDAYEYKVRQRVRKPGQEGTEAWIVGANGERLPPPPEFAAAMGIYETRVLGLVVVPKPGTRSGVVFITLTRGSPGSLAEIRNSFRFGKP